MVEAIQGSSVILNCAYTGKQSSAQADAVVLVTSRQMNDQLYSDLIELETNWKQAGIQTVKILGDAQAPGPIAWATYAGHRYARELDESDIGDALPFDVRLCS